MSRIVCIGILLALAAPNARAACIGESQGALRELEALAFYQPSEAAKRAHRMLEAAPDTTTTAIDSRATLWALAAEAHRQRGQVQAALDAARAGLATLGVHPNADLKLRLQIAQALAMHAAHNGAQGLVELDRAIVGIKNPSRAAACIQKDRGWIRYSEGDIEGALRDLVSAYQQLQISGPESERMVTAARLATVYASAREYDQATSLLKETLNYFVATGAQGRLPTTYDRLGRVYAAQKKFGEAIEDRKSVV